MDWKIVFVFTGEKKRQSKININDVAQHLELFHV